MKNILCKKRRYNLKDVCVIFVISILTYLILSLIIGAILNASIPSSIPEIEKTNYFSKRVWYPIVSFGAFPISFIVVVLCYGKITRLSFSDIILDNKFSMLDLLVSILLIMGMCFGFSYLNEYFIKFLQKFFSVNSQNIVLPDFSIGAFLSCFISVCVLPAICEELMFRKLFVNALEGVNLCFTIIYVGLLFSLFHFNPTQTLYQFVLGCVFVVVVKAAKSAYIAIIMHFLNNITVLICYFINKNMTIPLCFVIICFFIACVCIGYFVYKLIKNKEENSIKVKNCLFLMLPLLFTFVIWVMVL